MHVCIYCETRSFISFWKITKSNYKKITNSVKQKEKSFMLSLFFLQIIIFFIMAYIDGCAQLSRPYNKEMV